MNYIIQHKKYDKETGDYDFSLLKLTEKIKFKNTAQPIALPAQTYKIKDDKLCLVTGWGDTTFGGKQSTQLLGAKIPVLDKRKCINTYLNSPHENSEMQTNSTLENNKFKD